MQHCDYSDERARLAALGWHVGTIFAALEWPEFWDEEHHHARLRELPLERFLIDTDDGWVLRRAQTLRGRVQIEIEERYGQSLLSRLLSRPRWLATSSNYLLARECVRVVPHHAGGGDRTRTIRRLSSELAEHDPSFFDLRVRIHSSPGRREVDDTRAWIAAGPTGLSREHLPLARALLDELDRLLSPSGRFERLEQCREALAQHGGIPELDPLLLELPALDPIALLERMASVLRCCRTLVCTSEHGPRNVLLLSLSLQAEEIARIAAQEASSDHALSRGLLLAQCEPMVTAGYGAGWLSAGEMQAILGPVHALRSDASARTEDYLSAARGLERAGLWAAGAVRHAFAEPLVRYTALEPKAGRFVDELLRSSILLPLAHVAQRLVCDARRHRGQPHVVAGHEVSGLVGLSPGVATGRLRLLGEHDLHPARVSADEIVVLPRTVADLHPVAGLLSCDEGNVLSHLHLLARERGIPSACVPRTQLRHLEPLEGKAVWLAVSDEGQVVLADPQTLPHGVREGIEVAGSIRRVESGPGLAPVPDLTFTEPLSLAQVDPESGLRVVGRKTVNLAALARICPRSVPEAIALPFGMFVAQVAASDDMFMTRLEQLVREHRSGRLASHHFYDELEQLGRQLGRLGLAPSMQDAIAASLRRAFGEPGSYGVFVRSDTGYEDRPGCTGAGLNTTVPHAVGLEAIAAAIVEVWASPFRRRAAAWRSHAPPRASALVSAVLIMRTVPSDKSGVLVTTDMFTGDPGLTVATSWGVGGGVLGEAAETLRLRADGSDLLVSEAQAAFGREIAADGGTRWSPAAMGPVLTAKERTVLRELAAQLQRELPPSLVGEGALDVEFGFCNEQLMLFQVRSLRPSVGRGARGWIERLQLRSPAGPARIDLRCSPHEDA
ncbi:MAG: PEP/pyruvate-binding domain-containing protein [Myxococcota bacterium]